MHRDGHARECSKCGSHASSCTCMFTTPDCMQSAAHESTLHKLRVVSTSAHANDTIDQHCMHAMP